MKYEIKGGSLPVVICELNPGETLISESGAMGWMNSSIEMSTNMKGGLFAGIGRALSGESIFLNTFKCTSGLGKISFPSSFPGRIVTKILSENQSIICQKSAFLAGESSLKLSMYFKKKIGTGLFGGEGFILQKITGPGVVFLEFDGYIEEYSLSPNETIKVDTGHIAMFDESVNFDIKMIKGIKNVLFGGEGLFLAELTGPGKVYLQSMPVQNLAGQLSKYLDLNNNK